MSTPNDAPDWSVARPFWFDRNPLDASIFYRATIAPAPNVVRASYTVPANRLAMVEGITTQVVRATAPTTASEASVYVLLSGGKVMVDSTIWSGTVGDGRAAGMGAQLLLLTGQEVYIETSDFSTGGACYLQAGVKVTEFDL